MSHYAVIAPPFYSHLHALEQLSLALIEQGHRITFFQQADVRSLVRSSAIGFYALGAKSHPAGTLRQTLSLAAKPFGPSMFRLIDDMAKSTALFCRELPAACRALSIDGLIVDQMEPGGALVAKKLDLPYISVACALPLNREAGLPLAVMPFTYQQTAQAYKRYETSERIYDWMMRKHDDVVAQYAQAFGLSGITQLHHCFSPLAQLSQLVPELDFPRHQLPKHFHCVGPLRAKTKVTARASATDPQRCKVYASLGTLQGHRYSVFKKLVAACKHAQADLLIAHCGGLTAGQSAALAKTAGVEVVDFVDQPQAIAAADVTITHGGMNTVLDSIQHLTPLLVIPLAFDQPGVAARVLHHGVGQKLSRFASSKSWGEQLSHLREQPEIQSTLLRLQQAICQAGGSGHAASLASQALRSGQPVVARGEHG
ncbi:zeaxanthin glucosyltransferase [Rosenbergiella nectarea]|uniref:Zeaxanthin glucosyltransferase n=1 Tax=Rosenbergiella nectarea TaxID=988801 RepID=A0A1H9F5Y0_9GAMM|nr:glycosyltransferase [Rosenbergiella nectarea]SEQ33285.1 zeaxanthin glucosyltransferase [Rosenbergiella nectarea]